MNEFEVGKCYLTQNGQLRKVIERDSNRLVIAEMSSSGKWRRTGVRDTLGRSALRKELSLVPGAIATGLAGNPILYPPSSTEDLQQQPATPRPGLYADPSAKRDAEHQPSPTPIPERFDPFRNFEVKRGYGSSLEGTAEREFCPLDRVFPMPNAWGRW